MSHFLATLHRAKESHVGGAVQTLRDRGTSEFLIAKVERLLTNAFIAGARAATQGICNQEHAEVERLEAMEHERQRHQDSEAIKLMPGIEPGKLIELAIAESTLT
jgi:hypothetical protein